MALVTRLLYVARFRVDSDAYARAHKTYGPTTLHHAHARVEGSTVEFRFKGKHGIGQHKPLANQTIAKNAVQLEELPGPWLFQALVEVGRSTPTSARGWAPSPPRTSAPQAAPCWRRSSWPTRPARP
mgnify:CR=1 FL=1